MHCSMILRCINICSIAPRPFLKRACSWRSLLSIPSSIRVITILPRTFAAITISVMPLRLLHLVTTPFFGIFTINPRCQSSDICSYSLHLESKRWKSTPLTVPFFISLKAAWISAFVGTSMSIIASDLGIASSSSNTTVSSGEMYRESCLWREQSCFAVVAVFFCCEWIWAMLIHGKCNFVE